MKIRMTDQDVTNALNLLNDYIQSSLSLIVNGTMFRRIYDQIESQSKDDRPAYSIDLSYHDWKTVEVVMSHRIHIIFRVRHDISRLIPHDVLPNGPDITSLPKTLDHLYNGTKERDLRNSKVVQKKLNEFLAEHPKMVNGEG